MMRLPPLAPPRDVWIEMTLSEIVGVSVTLTSVADPGRRW